MTRNFFVFLGTFVAGALIALAARAAMFNPHRGHEGHAARAAEYAPMVSNPLTPAQSGGKSVARPKADASDPHAAHGVTSATAANDKPVNTVCAICGMDVNPNVPTLEYQGKKIGFGCKLCPPKFKADPDRYGPYYLRNEVIKK